MILLSFSCYCSELSVHPKNWLSPRASTKKDWYIFYRFYDPAYRDNPKFKKGKLVQIRGMNDFKDLQQRKDETKRIIDFELGKLKDQSYNPITGNIIEPICLLSDIEPYTPFIVALTNVEKRISCSPSTKRDLRSVLNFVSKASMQLGYYTMPISSLSRKHFKQLLLHIDISEGESAHRYNKIRSYLMILYKELIELEVVESNPLKDISKRKTVQRLKKLPTSESRKIISEYLFANEYRFWVFMQIFFHSGARITELMLVKGRDVSLEKQFFIVTVKKGAYYKEVKKPIKNVAVGFWKAALENCNTDDFVFSKNLMSGNVQIQSYQITKRWNRHVKKKLGIEEDFYSLKHLNLDETAAILGIDDAAAMASHTTAAITIKHYALNESDRQMERLKLIENVF